MTPCLCFSHRGKRNPAFIRCQERRRLARSRQHKAKLAAEEERLHDVAVESELESEPFMSATPSPSPPLPPPILPPRAVRRLTMDKNQADSPPPRSPSPERAASPVPLNLDRRCEVEKAPASPIVHCSQYRTEEYRLDVASGIVQPEAAYESDGPSSYPLAPTAPRKDQYVSESESECGRPRRRRRPSPPVTRILDGVLHVRKDYEGRLPLCYYDTGLRGYGPDDGYACFNMRDILWARRLRFHIERLRFLL